MNSLLVGIFVAPALWIFIKLRKSNSGLFKSLRPPPVRPSSQPPPEKREMPRIGVPGTVTDEQFKALKRNLFEPSKDWSFEEAALILDKPAKTSCLALKKRSNQCSRTLIWRSNRQR